MGILYQAISTGIVCYLCLIMGLMYAWPSSTIKLFESANTTLHRPMDETELALFGSLSSIGAVISTPIAGYFLDIVGRKYCALSGALMHVITWTLLAGWRRVEVLLVAMFLSGLGGCVFLIVPVFVSEICQESIRGTMTACAMLFYSTGILASYLLGGFLQYDTMMLVGLSMAVGAVIMLTFVKESPVFLLQKGREEEATKSIAFFRNTSTDSKEVLEELATIRRAINSNIDGSDVTPEEQKLKPDAKNREKLPLWQFIKKSPPTRQGLFVCLTLCSASIFQGLVAVQVYAEPLFQEAVPSISPTLCSIILAIITVVVGIGAAYMTDKYGRRNLMIYSSVATGLSCVLIGTQVHLRWGPHWLTIVFIYLFCISYTFGAGTIPYVLVAEIFLPEVKSFMTMLVIEWAWLCNFILLFVFNPVVSAIGLGSVFYIFAIICVLSAVFCIVYLPETKGLPVDVIQTLFLKRIR